MLNVECLFRCLSHFASRLHKRGLRVCSSFEYFSRPLNPSLNSCCFVFVMRIITSAVLAAVVLMQSAIAQSSSSSDSLSKEEMSEFVDRAEANFVSEIGLPPEALDKRWRKDSLNAWIPEGTSYESVVSKLEKINAAKGFSFRIIRDSNYVCIERTYYRKRNGMAISLMVVVDEKRLSTSTSLSRSLYKLPINES